MRTIALHKSQVPYPWLLLPEKFDLLKITLLLHEFKFFWQRQPQMVPDPRLSCHGMCDKSQ